MEANLLGSIINLLEHMGRPMSDKELTVTLGCQFRRHDPEFYHRLHVILRDGVKRGILIQRGNLFSLQSRTIFMPMKFLKPPLCRF
ncbi:uncharacterized protein LOC27208143 [Drosophila simulans]|uniref:uncharacterized protein LOC27208143 n=1 Tax=Drosophila simulans TaxID=7240 RepID=UPI00078AF023|nr:uncharacterized protein LOC27208143 [Drosophila simulans]KMZ08145.1 uncharacterized protein Dsimw501_GD28295 [Drosophila simulans]